MTKKKTAVKPKKLTKKEIKDLKQKYAEHLRYTKGEELDTSDAYAVEWTVNELLNSGTSSSLISSK